MDPCKKYACRLQTCLQKFDYNQTKCQDIIDKLTQCCKQEYFSNANNPKYNVSPSCSGFASAFQK